MLKNYSNRNANKFTYCVPNGHKIVKNTDPTNRHTFLFYDFCISHPIIMIT